MGIEEQQQEEQQQEIEVDKTLRVASLNHARRIAMFNSETIYYLKNSLELLDSLKQKELSDKHEKFDIIIRTNYPLTDVELVLANNVNKSNHNITLLDVELIQETLLEGLRKEEDNTREGGFFQR